MSSANDGDGSGPHHAVLSCVVVFPGRDPGIEVDLEGRRRLQRCSDYLECTTTTTRRAAARRRELEGDLHENVDFIVVAAVTIAATTSAEGDGHAGKVAKQIGVASAVFVISANMTSPTFLTRVAAASNKTPLAVAMPELRLEPDTLLSAEQRGDATVNVAVAVTVSKDTAVPPPAPRPYSTSHVLIVIVSLLVVVLGLGALWTWRRVRQLKRQVNVVDGEKARERRDQAKEMKKLTAEQESAASNVLGTVSQRAPLLFRITVWRRARH